MRELPIGPDQQTVAFFDRPVRDVVGELTERVYIVDTPRKSMPIGTPKVITLSTSEGEKNYRVTLAEPYGEEDASPVWSGKRLAQIKSLKAGGVVAFKSRVGTLSFIKARGGENIQIRELEDIATGKKTRSSTEVTRILGLSHGQEGKLSISGEGHLRFERAT